MLAYHILLRYVWSTTALRLGYESLEAEQELVILLVATMSFYPCTGYGKSLDFALLPEVIANSLGTRTPVRELLSTAVLHTYCRRI